MGCDYCIHAEVAVVYLVQDFVVRCFMKKHTFIFTCTDNGGGHQSFEVKATDKQEAIEKGMKFAKKYACGDICGNWECRLKPDVGL